jgi:hypothetical protein
METQPDPDQRRFAHTAAVASVAAPFIVILLNAAGKSHSATAGPPKLILPLVCVVLILTGFVCAVIALCNVQRFGRRGLLARGLAGLIINGIFVAAMTSGFLAGFAKGVKARQTANRQLTAAVEDVGKSLRKNFDPENGITNIDFAAAEKFRRELDKAATNLDPETARVAKVSSAYVARMEGAGRKLQATLTEITAAKVLDMSNVTSVKDLQDRRTIVTRYLADTEGVKMVVTNASAFYRTELLKMGSSPARVERFIRDIEFRGAEQRRLLLEVRDSDVAMAQSMLSLLQLLENSWGSWSAEGAVVRFEDSGQLRAYNRLVEQIQSAGKAQVAAQRQLVSLRAN